MRKHNGQFMSKRAQILRLVGLVLAIWLLVWIYQQGTVGNNEYNRHMCAVYGFQADCKTPLPDDQKLK